MSFIRVQKLVRDNDGYITGGTAAIIDSEYVSGEKYHSRQKVRERLGKVLYFDSESKTGIFLSPSRGLVEYNSKTDSFSPVSDVDDRLPKRIHTIQETEVHTVFGDSYLLIKFLESSGLLAILRTVFPKDSEFERLMAHVVHSIMKDGSRITCDNFIEKSFASYVLGDIAFPSLRSDTEFFALMGDDRTRMAFFKCYIESMKKNQPDFGTGCYIDSTPLPNDIDNNPFNALCCHGVSSSAVQMRLILVLDDTTGMPVWYDIIPGNVLDLSTVMNVLNDVGDSLGITVNSVVLDAGYISKELIAAFHNGTEKTVIGRMPARKGYPFKELYWQVKSLIGKGKYEFVCREHPYFGYKKEISLFEQSIYAYVYVNQFNALQRYRDYLIEHREEYDELKNRDKDWYTVKYGYFVLISNIDTPPADLLTQYFCRTEIERVFKTSKDYLELMPLRKWTDQTVRGKILYDIINTIILLMLQRQYIDKALSMNKISGKTQSLMCHRDSQGRVSVETPNKKTKEYYNLLGVQVPASVKVDQFRSKVLQLKM